MELHRYVDVTSPWVAGVIFFGTPPILWFLIWLWMKGVARLGVAESFAARWSKRCLAAAGVLAPLAEADVAPDWLWFAILPVLAALAFLLPAWWGAAHRREAAAGVQSGVKAS